MANITLKTSSGSNVIATDPDRIGRRLYKIHALLGSLGGRRIEEAIGIHYDHELIWNHMTAAQFEALRELYYANELLYLDDGNVPLLTENSVYAAGETLNFVGITSPSGTHKGYKGTLATLPSHSDYDAFEDTELSTVEYQKIDTDDSNCIEQNNPALSYYLFQEYIFEMSISREDVGTMSLKVIGLSDDGSIENVDGCSIWLNRGATGWTKVISSTTSAKTDLEWSTEKPEIAQLYVGPLAGDNNIRILHQTRGLRFAQSWDLVAEYNGSERSINCMISFGGKIYAGTSDSGKLLEWNGSDAWVEVGSLPGAGTIKSIIEFDSKIYCGVGGGTYAGQLYEWDGVDTLTKKADLLGDGDYVYDMVEHDSELYAVMWNSDQSSGGMLYKWNGTDAWGEVAPKFGSEYLVVSIIVFDDGGGDDIYGGGTPNGKLLQWNGVDAWTEVAPQYGYSDFGTLHSIDGELYLVPSIGSFEDGLLKWNKTNAWTQEVADQPVGGSIYATLTIEDSIYVTTRLASTYPLNLHRWTAGESVWTLIGVSEDVSGRSMPSLVYHNSEIYGGTSHASGGTEYDSGRLYRYNPDGAQSALSLHSYYVEVNVNGPEEHIITLTHTPVLDAGDVIWVKNLTTVATLELTVDYTISGREITISGQSNDDDIEVKYNRYHEVKFANLPEEWLAGDPGSDRTREAIVRTTTQTQNIK